MFSRAQKGPGLLCRNDSDVGLSEASDEELLSTGGGI
jgi:hypothetical protein